MKRALTGLVALLGVAGVCTAGWFHREADHIIVIRGTVSIQETAERPFAALLSSQVSNWLTDLGLPHTTLTDEEVTPRSIRGARAVILPYNPNPTAAEIEAFGSVLHSGGILVVCYSRNPELAALMGVKTGPYRKASTPGEWSGFSLDTTALPGAPRHISQQSDHMIPVYPDSGEARILARWTAATGLPTPEPAWVSSRGGFWMSHVLLPGDDENKQQLLLAMMATALPEVWRQATRHLMDDNRPFGHYASLGAAKEDLGFTNSSRFPIPSSFLQKWRERGSPTTYASAREALRTLTLAYAKHQNLSQSFAQRGIWASRPSLQDAKAWQVLADNGINLVFLDIGRALDLPDALPDLAALSGADAPAVHAWLTCLNLEGLPEAKLRELGTQQRLQVSDTGETLAWLCPSHPANADLLAAVAARIARTPRYSGLHLDYIRCRNVHSCYCPGCRERFAKSTGLTIAKWPDAVQSGELGAAYRTWRADQITRLVTAMSRAARQANPAITVSAAVYGATPSCLTSVAQDWPLWIRTGLIDWACPMNYSSDLQQFDTLLKAQVALHCPERILPGVGVTSSLSRLTPDQTVAELKRIREAGFPGFSLFEFSPAVGRNVLPCLGMKGIQP